MGSREGAARIPRRFLKPTRDCLKRETALWCSNGTPCGGPSMTVHKQSVSFTDAAFAFARELVEAGEYPNVSAAVSGEMARAKAARERERTLLEAEVQRRLALPPDQWEPVAALDTFTVNAREHLARLKSAQENSATA